MLLVVGVWIALQPPILAGFTPEEAWVAATRWAGESLGVPKLGTLDEGAPADFDPATPRLLRGLALRSDLDDRRPGDLLARWFVERR